MSESLACLQTLEILPMLPADVPAVAAMEALATAFPWKETHFNDALASGYPGWVLRDGAGVLGQAMVMQVLDEVHLLNISIHPAAQGKGLGGRLLRQVMQQTHAQGGTTMLLEVRVSNAPALRLYRNFGFQEIGRRKGYYPAEDGREDALVLQRPLP